ncbi:hypothetical protein WN66_05583 [Saccharomyces cerevisiae]|uniref:Putative uncharacterized protein YNR025C n=2 Tax=Saccharomyces cerevisiae TaxID=4932 RepID=YN8E_YEAST|nr:RecName: Full=Putative uncharacterized protein YNR025C [Saccharomyces cerevisiae S288C]AAT93349.1 YNR025C [Saccharomyces cerevisiae]KZV08652.1 hypothetical protein WN66_05583 [Saccharomyces cerevisiae]CAA96304.1 unnamed protein product [Saccharomyces cerevisiae]CAY82218.1 EC1118_1N18_0672p [Saccharomyces cerevisiae EC1118]
MTNTKKILHNALYYVLIIIYEYVLLLVHCLRYFFEFLFLFLPLWLVFFFLMLSLNNLSRSYSSSPSSWLPVNSLSLASLFSSSFCSPSSNFLFLEPLSSELSPKVFLPLITPSGFRSSL